MANEITLEKAKKRAREYELHIFRVKGNKQLCRQDRDVLLYHYEEKYNHYTDLVRRFQTQTNINFKS